MTHMVLHQSADGQAVYHQTESLEEAARHVEQLRNAGQGADARIFRMHEVPIEVKTYYKVELPADADGDAAPAAAAATAPAPAPAAEAAPAPPAATPAAAPPPAAVPVKGEPAAAAAGAGANGGRFGLFGKG